MTTTVVLRAPLALGAIVLAVATPAAQGQAVLYAFHGDSALDGLGTFAAGAGDVNGDGFGDVIAGAPGDDNNGSDSGSARVFSGADGTILYMFNGSSADDLFGWSVDGAGDAFGNSVDGAGDLDGDGFSDLIVGAPSNNTFGKQAGMVQAFSGKDGSILYTRYGSKSHRFGWSVRGAGDVNADNLDDVIVGVWGDNNNGPFSGGARVLGGNTGSILHAFSMPSSCLLRRFSR